MYELGYTVNGGRFIVWQGRDYPPPPAHDILTAAARVIKVTCPKAKVEVFHEYNGQSYSY